MQIPYLIGQGKCRETSVSLSPCPHGKTTEQYAITLHVGGQACMLCRDFVRKNVTTQEVTCAHD